MLNNKPKHVKFFIALLIAKEKYISVKILHRIIQKWAISQLITLIENHNNITSSKMKFVYTFQFVINTYKFNPVSVLAVRRYDFAEMNCCSLGLIFSSMLTSVIFAAFREVSLFCVYPIAAQSYRGLLLHYQPSTHKTFCSVVKVNTHSDIKRNFRFWPVTYYTYWIYSPLPEWKWREECKQFDHLSLSIMLYIIIWCSYCNNMVSRNWK